MMSDFPEPVGATTMPLLSEARSRSRTCCWYGRSVGVVTAGGVEVSTLGVSTLEVSTLEVSTLEVSTLEMDGVVGVGDVISAPPRLGTRWRER